MGNVSFSDRFELFELLREDEVQTFRARERATGRAVEAHFSKFPEALDKLESAFERGSHEGKFYAITTPLGLDSAGAWRVKPPAGPAPAPSQQPAAEPGDFTRMFQLRQAPEPVATPVAKPAAPGAVPASQPGEFTRAFKRPERAPSVAPSVASEPGQPGEFTRMFQKPAPTVVPEPPKPMVQPTVTPSAAPSRVPVAAIVIAIVLLAAIAVFVLMRTLY